MNKNYKIFKYKGWLYEKHKISNKKYLYCNVLGEFYSLKEMKNKITEYELSNQ